MARLVLILVIAVVAVWWLVGRGKRLRTGDGTAKSARGGDTEEMVKCAHCGVHLPRGDAVTDDALAYCSDAHRAAGPRAR